MDISHAQFSATAPRDISTTATANEKRARETAKEFEAMFVTQMLNHMSSEVNNGEGYFGGGHAEAMFRPMLNEEYGKQIANGRGMGLQDAIYRTLLKQQEV